MLKSVPSNPESVIIRFLELLFVIFNVFVTFLPIFTLPKSRELGETEIAGGLAERAAVTAISAFMITTHVPVPEHAPDQPPKVDPDAGVAVNVTLVP